IEKKHLYFLFGIVLIIGIAVFVAAQTQNNPGHMWDEMDCDTDFCVDTDYHSVGIGIDTPGQELHIKSQTGNNADLRLEEPNGNAWDIAVRDVTADLRFAYQGEYGGFPGDKLTIKPGGNVGIGTTNPQQKLEVRSTTDGIFGIKLGRSGVSDDHNSWIIWNMDGDYGNNFEIWNYPLSGSGGGRRFRIESNGDIYIPQSLGVGVSPTSKLQVAGIVHSTSGGFKFPDNTIQTTAATGGGGGTVTHVAAGTGISVEPPTSGGTLYTVTSTVVDTQLSQATVETYVANDVNTGWLPRDTVNKFENSPIYTTSSLGDVGIGTTSPTEKLHVVGNIKASGEVKADNTLKTYVGATPSSYTGSGVGGYSGGNSKCNIVYPGSRMCTAADFANSRPTSTGWYSTFVSHPAPGSTYSKDCLGWSSFSSGDAGPFWFTTTGNEGGPGTNPCSSLDPILCCD
ncbi:MAG: hypothetical protein ABIB47_00825, partial [Candidatus Woesearchaeota archaeon]